MSAGVVASLTLGQTSVVVQQTTDCTAVLTNRSAGTLRDLNPHNCHSFPAIEVTDLATGTQTMFAQRLPVQAAAHGDEVAAGCTWRKSVSISDWIDLTEPGIYDFRARHLWDGGEAVSPPVRLILEPARPRVVALAGSDGGPMGKTLAAWVREIDPYRNVYELWLSSLSLRGRPALHSSLPATALNELIEPVVSAPRTPSDSEQWIAWISRFEDSVQLLAHRSGEFSDIMEVPLTGPGYIVPPLLCQDGAFILLHIPGRLLLTWARAGIQPETKPLHSMNGPIASWARAVCLPDGRRYAFLVQSYGEHHIIQLTDWKRVRALGGWHAKLLSADLRLCHGAKVAGAFLGERPGADPYVVNTWSWSPADGFCMDEPVPLRWPRGYPLVNGIVRVREDAAAWALLCGLTPETRWYVSSPDGDVAPLDAGLRAPCDLLFPDGSRPYILDAHPDLGFRFLPAPRPAGQRRKRTDHQRAPRQRSLDPNRVADPLRPGLT